MDWVGSGNSFQYINDIEMISIYFRLGWAMVDPENQRRGDGLSK